MLAKKPLTDRTIKAVKPAPLGKRTLLWDAIVPGLALRVTDRGKRSFVLISRYPGSTHPVPRSLGPYGAITLEQARTKARQWLELIASGVDPGRREIEQRQETFKAIATNYFARRAKDHRTRKLSEATLERLVYPTLGARPIDTITRSDIVRLLDQIEDGSGPVMADNTLWIVNRIMNWHATRSDTFRSPIVRGMNRAKEQARSRILDDDELRAIWRASGDYDHPFGPMLRFILLTATRRNEVRYAKRSEITGTEWTIPASRYKTMIDHVIPLSQAALAALDGAGQGHSSGPLLADGNPTVSRGTSFNVGGSSYGEAEAFIFSANGKQAFGGLDRHKRAIDEASGVKGWVIHDLRRTARSLMSRAGVNADIAERCLGHVIPGVRGIYDRHEYFEEKRRAFEALAGQIERIINPQDNIVSIGQGR
jgi:integrase